MRGLRNNPLNRLAIWVASTTLIALPLSSNAQFVDEGPSAFEMMVDGLVMRPITLTATVAGSLVWIATLPFSMLGGNIGDSADNLILQPAKSTFWRCLGCKTTGRKVDYPDELDELEDIDDIDDFKEIKDIEDIEQYTAEDDFNTGEITKADEDLYGAQSQEDFTADLELPKEETSIFSYEGEATSEFPAAEEQDPFADLDYADESLPATEDDALDKNLSKDKEIEDCGF